MKRWVLGSTNHCELWWANFFQASGHRGCDTLLCALPIHHTHRRVCALRHKLSLSFVTVFLLLVFLLPFICPKVWISPSRVSNCKIKLSPVLAYFRQITSHVSVHLFAQQCMMLVRGSWMQNNTNTNRVGKIRKNRTMWRAGLKPTRSGISGYDCHDQVLATVLLQAGGWIRDSQNHLIWWLLIKLAHSEFHYF